MAELSGGARSSTAGTSAPSVPPAPAWSKRRCFVTTRDEQTIAMDVEAAETIGNLKAKIEAEYGRVRVLVQDFMGMWLTYDVDPSDTIDDVKAKIQAKYGTAPDLQVVNFDACVGAERLTVFIHRISGSTIVLEASHTNTIAAIKQMIFNQEGIPPEQQRLMYEEIQLRSRFSLYHYNIPHEASLQLIVLAPGNRESVREDHDGQDHPPRR